MHLLAELAHAGASPGFEQETRDIIIREIQEHADELRISRLGSVVATKRASIENLNEKPLKILITGGMSQVGFVVKQVEATGLVHLYPLGEWHPQLYIGRHVLVKTNNRTLQGVIKTSPHHLHEVIVDLGLPEKEVLKVVEIGNLVGLKPDFSEDQHLISGQTLEHVAAIYTLIEVMKNVKKENLKCHFSVAFTNQEHLKTRKHMQEHFRMSPDLTLNLDCLQVEKSHCLGGGPIIGSSSRSDLAHPLVVNTIKRIASKHSIPHQISHIPEVELQMMQRNLLELGCYSGGISIPVEPHEPMGLRAFKTDIKNTCKLLECFSTHYDFGDFEKIEEEVVEENPKEYNSLGYQPLLENPN